MFNNEFKTKEFTRLNAEIKQQDPSYNAPTTVPSGGCYIATAVYGSYDCPEVWTLRRFRDSTLASTWYGLLFTKTYYAVSPTLVRWFGDSYWFRKMLKPKLDALVANLKKRGFEDTPYQDL